MELRMRVHEALAWLWFCVHLACMSFTHKAWAAAPLGLHWSDTMVMFWGFAKAPLWLYFGYLLASAGAASAWRKECVMAAVAVGKNKFVCNSFSSSSLTSSLLSRTLPPGFSNQCRQCEQRDNWHRQQIIFQNIPACTVLLLRIRHGRLRFIHFSALECYIAFIQEYSLCCFCHLHRHSMNGVLWIWTISSASDSCYDLS